MRLKRPYRNWTAAETDQLRALYGTMPRADLAKLLNRHVFSLSAKATQLGLIAPRPEAVENVLPHVRTAGEAGITVQQASELAGCGDRHASKALLHALETGEVYRHREGPRFRYYATRELAQAGEKRARRDAAEHKRAAGRQLYATKMASLGRSVVPRGTPRAAKPAAVKKRPHVDRRPGVQQLVTLPGTPASVRTSAHRGPAHLPGKPHVPKGVIVKRGPDTRDTRYTADPNAYGLGLASRRPGEYADAPRPWAAAAVASRGDGHGA